MPSEKQSLGGLFFFYKDMTKAERLLLQQETQIQKAIEAERNGDLLAARLHVNAAEGFKRKLGKLTLQEAEQVG